MGPSSKDVSDLKLSWWISRFSNLTEFTSFLFVCFSSLSSVRCVSSEGVFFFSIMCVFFLWWCGRHIIYAKTLLQQHRVGTGVSRPRGSFFFLFSLPSLFSLDKSKGFSLKVRVFSFIRGTILVSGTVRSTS
jgi:hypothetical protein